MARLWGSLLLLACAWRLASALTCRSCEDTTCEEVDCPGELVKDECGCCDECAKGEGDPCGGYYNSRGRCGSGLVCRTSPQHGAAIRIDAEGICIRNDTDCVNILCQLILGRCVCSERPGCSPPDVDDDPTTFTSWEECEKAASKEVGGGGEGVLAPTITIPPTAVSPAACEDVRCETSVDTCPSDSVMKTLPSEQPDCCPAVSACLCDLESCPLAPECPKGQEAALETEGRLQPGECCNQWKCEMKENCENVTCPTDTPIACPADSYRLPPSGDPSNCCPPPAGACQCLPDHCAPPSCPEGTQVTQIAAGTGRPGACCSVFQCVSESEASCTHKGNTYQAGEKWKSNKCTTCECKGALTFCNTEECPSLVGCSKVTHDAAKCCPMCVDGCLSPSGVHHNNSEQWLEDDCTTCSCNNGLLHCQAEMCHITCRNPRHVPGRCCPVCDVCDVTCQHGYRTDREGQPICECLSADDIAEDPPKCRSMANCKKNCPHGFRVDSRGCERCKCKRCRKLKNCTKACVHGFEVNDRGCTICKCRPAPVEVVPITSTEDHFILEPAETSHLSCITEDGTVYDEGEAWHDGCRQCYCHGGVEMCAIIACPAPQCDRPDIAPGNCCPTCPGVEHPPVVNLTVCQTVDGASHVEGETWSMDPCTRCLCHAGRVLCHSVRCPPAACDAPQRHPADCCPTCAPSGRRQISRRPCRADDGSVYPDGDSWRRGACWSCACEDGEIRCFQQQCPQVDCDRPVLQKHHCCPACIGPPQRSGCLYENRTMSEGETWDVDTCSSCVCQNGQTVCAQKICSVACDNPVPVPGQCCPVCKDESPRRSYPFLNGTSKATHRTRIPIQGNPTQSSRPGREREKGVSATSIHHIVIYTAIVLILLLIVLLVWCQCLRRHRSGYSPKHDATEEKKPLNAPQIMHFSHLDARPLQNDKLITEKSISVIRDT